MFKKGAVIKLNEKLFRIIGSDKTDLLMIELNVDKYHFYRTGIQNLVEIPGVEEVKDPYEQHAFMVSEDEMDKLEKLQAAIRMILQETMPHIEDLGSNRSTPGIKAFMETFGVSKRIAHKYIRRYLQSGQDIYSLRDGRKTRTGPEHDMFHSPYRGGHAFADGSVRKAIDPAFEKKCFEEGFKKIDVERSLSFIVDMLNVKYFCDPVLDEDGNLVDIIVPPEAECLSERRFRRYCKERIGAVALSKYKKGARDRTNNHRLKFGTAQTGCTSPGAVVEIDACELDIIIVGKDRRQDLGRPVVYFAVDVYSTKIIGYYVGLENNSFYGATSLFNNMFFSCDRILPDSIRVDQGSEWISDSMRRMGNELGIHVRIVPPAMGSYKGLVENSFHIYQKQLRNAGREYGAIYKVYKARHYDKACLLLEDIRQDIESFVSTYNATSRKTYELSKDMILNKVRPIPNELWEYGITNISIPRIVTESMEAKIVFSLCVPMRKSTDFSLSKSGITVKGLTYISNDPIFTELIKRTHFKTGPEDYEVRIDPRTVGHIWIRIGKQAIKVPLGEKHDALQSFKDLTWFEYDLLYADMKDDQRTLKESDRHLRLLLLAKTGIKMKKGKKAQAIVGGKNKKKEIREERRLAQLDDRRQNVLGIPTINNKMPELPTQDTKVEEIPAQDLTSSIHSEQTLPAEQSSVPSTEVLDYENESENDYEDYF